MKFTAEVTQGVYWVGENDRITPLFERLWPLPHGVAYNSYLLVDEQSVLMDTVCECADGGYLEAIESILGERTLDYLVINHMEPDHSGDIPIIVNRYPNIKIIGNKQTKKIYESYFPPQMHGRFMEVTDGQELNIGTKTLRFVFTPWVHWPEVMMTYETHHKILFSADAFGTFGTLDGGIFDDEMDATRYEAEMLRYYSNIVGKYSKFTQKALQKLADLPISIVCALHGPVWRKDPSWVISRYDKWSKQEGEPGAVVAVASMYGSTLDLGEYIARRLCLEGVRNIVVHDVSKTHISYIIADIWKYKGLALGSVAYNTEMHPNMAHLCHELKNLGIANKALAIFGGASWSGGGVRNLVKFADEASLPLATNTVEMMGRATSKDLAACDILAKELAQKILA